MKQEIAFYVEGSKDPRPNSRRTMYVDGSAANHFREGIDGELSHWRPNKTEPQYRAGTSTEICFKYRHANPNINYELVVNNHLDVDGVLSVFTLTHPQVALAHETAIIQAAEAGDFWAWAEKTAFNLFQELSLLFQKLETSKTRLGESYQHCFDLILKILADQPYVSETEKILHQQYALIDSGNIIREELTPRVLSYHVPKETTEGKPSLFLRTAKFNEPISERLAFWPQVRNRLDAQKTHLVSVENENCVHYDFWLPGYCWADTSGLWQPPGLTPATRIGEVNHLHWHNLSNIVKELNTLEQGMCHWSLYPGIVFANTKNPRDFPIILSTFSKQNRGSHLAIETVKELFRQL